MSQTYTSNDFNDILDSLVLFMRNQDEFKDMNFDGSAIRELMRVLSFNAQQQAFDNNFTYNELQLDTAQLRQNVTSIASRLGYTPSSKTAAKLKVNLVVKPSDLPSAPASITLSQDTQFYATKDGQTFIFSPDQAYSANLGSDGTYQLNNVQLLQGIWTVNGYMVQSSYGFDSYVIPNADVDTSTLAVYVRTSETSGDASPYTQFQSAYDLDASAQLFFLRENRDGLFEFKFGDGKFAKKLSAGNVITAKYLVTRGIDGNNLSNISAVASIDGFYDITVNLIDDRSYGGDDNEDIESIRTLSPLTFASDGNAVTGGDYVARTKRLFTEAQDAICWGGEENVPPRYGYVFLSVIPKNSPTLSDSQKQSLVDILKKYNVGSVSPIIVDPVYTYINVDTSVKYRPVALAITTTELENKIKEYLSSYSVEKMEKFGGELEMSDLSEFIDKIDPAIKGNYTVVSYEKRFVPLLNTASSYVLDFAHKLYPGSVAVNNFQVSDTDSAGYTYSMYDDNGVLKLHKTNGVTTVEISDNSGSVDYDRGIVRIDGFKPNILLNGYIQVTASCLASDDQSLIAVRNSLLTINNVDVTLQAVTK